MEQSLQCIDFDDFEPPLARIEAQYDEAGAIELRTLAIDPLFSMTAIKVLRGEFFKLCGGRWRSGGKDQCGSWR